MLLYVYSNVPKASCSIESTMLQRGNFIAIFISELCPEISILQGCFVCRSARSSIFLFGTWHCEKVLQGNWGANCILLLQLLQLGAAPKRGIICFFSRLEFQKREREGRLLEFSMDAVVPTISFFATFLFPSLLLSELA